MKPTLAFAIYDARSGLPAMTSDGRAHIYIREAEAREAWRMGGGPDALHVTPVEIRALAPNEERTVRRDDDV